MHASAHAHAAAFAQTLDASRPLRILDVGALDVNGTMRDIFARGCWRYVGADLVPGPNVDVVLAAPYAWQLDPVSVDVVVTSSCLEHVPEPWTWMRELVRVLAPGGLLYCCVPGVCPYHPSPLDCWRVFPDGLAALFAWAGLEVISVSQGDSSEGQGRTDTVGIGRKP